MSLWVAGDEFQPLIAESQLRLHHSVIEVEIKPGVAGPSVTKVLEKLKPSVHLPVELFAIVDPCRTDQLVTQKLSCTSISKESVSGQPSGCLTCCEELALNRCSFPYCRRAPPPPPPPFFFRSEVESPWKPFRTLCLMTRWSLPLLIIFFIAGFDLNYEVRYFSPQSWRMMGAARDSFSAFQTFNAVFGRRSAVAFELAGVHCEELSKSCRLHFYVFTVQCLRSFGVNVTFIKSRVQETCWCEIELSTTTVTTDFMQL